MLWFGSHQFGSSVQIVQPTSNHLKRIAGYQAQSWVQPWLCLLLICKQPSTDPAWLEKATNNDTNMFLRFQNLREHIILARCWTLETKWLRRFSPGNAGRWPMLFARSLITFILVMLYRCDAVKVIIWFVCRFIFSNVALSTVMGGNWKWATVYLRMSSSRTEREGAGKPQHLQGGVVWWSHEPWSLAWPDPELKETPGPMTIFFAESDWPYFCLRTGKFPEFFVTLSWLTKSSQTLTPPPPHHCLVSQPKGEGGSISVTFRLNLTRCHNQTFWLWTIMFGWHPCASLLAQRHRWESTFFQKPKVWRTGMVRASHLLRQ